MHELSPYIPHIAEAAIAIIGSVAFFAFAYSRREKPIVYTTQTQPAQSLAAHSLASHSLHHPQGDLGTSISQEL